MNAEKWLLYPICKIEHEIECVRTELKNFSFFYPKCKQETFINVDHMNKDPASNFYKEKRRL